MRSFLWKFIKSLLFRVDAETAHHFVLRALRLMRRMSTPLRISSGAGALGTYRADSAPENLPKLWGIPFQSRVGLAAGFDKDAEVVTALPHLGFGFAEIGTVTPRPQPGNDRPRLFRDPSRSALFNRMGFNSLGAALGARNLADARPNLPENFRIGVNIGKNKDTPLENAAQDYADAIRHFRDLADYVVINVSSPNTPGLRSLQTVESLKPIVHHVNEIISAWTRRPPLLVKFAPEIQGEDLKSIMDACESWGVNGWVLTNTLGGTHRNLTGGWSGGPLTSEARRALVEARSFSKLPIISVGGILTPDEARNRIQSGADLVQLYTGWVYQGPSFPVAVSKALRLQ